MKKTITLMTVLFLILSSLVLAAFTAEKAVGKNYSGNSINLNDKIDN